MICLSATTVQSASPLENAIIFCVPLDEYTKELLKNVTPLDTDRQVGRYDAPSLSLQHSMLAVCEVACELPEEATVGQDMQVAKAPIVFVIH